MRGIRSALPPREALILLAVINHPWLLDTHAEELAALEFRHADGDRLRPAILDAAASRAPADAAAMRAAISARELGALLARVEQAHHPSVRLAGARSRAAEDVSLWWTHVVTLHRKSRTLHKELKDAEQALGTSRARRTSPGCAIFRPLAALDGTEARSTDLAPCPGGRCGHSEA